MSNEIPGSIFRGSCPHAIPLCPCLEMAPGAFEAAWVADYERRRHDLDKFRYMTRPPEPPPFGITVTTTPGPDNVKLYVGSEWEGMSSAERNDALKRAMAPGRRRREDGPSAAASAPSVQRGPLVFCQSQYDPDES